MFGIFRKQHFLWSFNQKCLEITQKCVKITLLLAKRALFVKYYKGQRPTTGCWFLLDYSLNTWGMVTKYCTLSSLVLLKSCIYNNIPFKLLSVSNTSEYMQINDEESEYNKAQKIDKMYILWKLSEPETDNLGKDMRYAKRYSRNELLIQSCYSQGNIRH